MSIPEAPATMKLAALIPAYNDDYALGFCLASIVEHFDEIVVFDDASTDGTPDVAADFARRCRRVRLVRHEGRQLGWIEARNRLARLTDADHIFWLDSDDVLCEYNAHLLRVMAERAERGGPPIVRFCLTEMWGDFFHTTQRLRHYDRCHFYMNRRALKDFVWAGGTCARCNLLPQEEGRDECGDGGRSGRRGDGAVHAINGMEPLFFHIKGVKPDRRLAERHFIRSYLRDPRRPDHLGDFAVPAVVSSIAEMSPTEAHDIALRVLLHSRQDRLTPTYLTGSTVKTVEAVPDRPEAIQRALPGRFEIVYRDGRPIDRIDRALCGGVEHDGRFEAMGCAAVSSGCAVQAPVQEVQPNHKTPLEGASNNR
jgi:hypothetical protein